jgi:hypothetical protein
MNETGITSTPVIDPAAGILYIVALDEDDSRLVAGQTCVHADSTSAAYCTTYECSQPTIAYRLHAIDVVSGEERPGSPVTIAGEAEGNGSASVKGKITFDARLSLQRASLLLDYGTIYFATASYADIGHYHGWIFAYDAATLAQKAVFNDTPNGTQGGIWMSGRLMLSDHRGYVYAVTGNGTFDSNADGGADYGDSVLKLDSTTLQVVDWFSPFLSDLMGFNYLAEHDDDLGSAGATLIPNTTFLLASGKLGAGYVIDTTNMGHWQAKGNSVVQEVRLARRLDRTACGGSSWIYGTPAIWAGPDGTHVYVWGSNDYLRDYLLDDDGLFETHGICFCAPGWSVEADGKTYTVDVSDPPCAIASTMSPADIDFLPGGVMSVSSNGKEAGTGIVWATLASMDPISHSVPGSLQAYDATSLLRPLWTSDMNPSRDSLGNWAKFVPPTIANGKVYLATQSNQLVVYGLLKDQ